ncbi:hypothetical protein EI969_11070 [Pseudomonas sp. PB101]|nr:hypothetical protein [Pseudomonas sp. PB101]
MPGSCGKRKTLWELACQRRGRHIQHQHCLTGRHRGQARSHRLCVVPGSCGKHKTLWELACQRRGRHIQHQHCLAAIER